MAGVFVCVQLFMPVVKAEKTSVAPNEGVVRVNLEQAIKIALSDNPTIIVAGQEIELKKTAKKDIEYNLLPTVDVSATYNRNLIKQTMVMDFDGNPVEIKMGTDNQYSGGVSVSLPVFAPTLYRTIHMTDVDIELAVEKSRASQLDMVNQVTKAYYLILLTQDSYDVLLKSFAQAEANFKVVNELYRVGGVSEYDKIRADVQVRSLQPAVVSARNGVNLAKLQLKVLMGLVEDSEIEVEGNLKDYETVLSERRTSAGDLNLGNNSNLRQLDLSAEMLQKSLEIQKASFLPTVGVAYSYAYTSLNNDFKIGEYKWFPYSYVGYTSLNNDFKIGEYKWFPYSYVGLSVSVPIFKASNYTKLRQTRIQMGQLRETRLNTERMLYMQMSSYLDNMSASSEQLASNKEGVLQAEKGRMIAQKRYEVGKGTILELNDSEVALTQAQLMYNQSIYDYLVAKAELEKMIGN